MPDTINVTLDPAKILMQPGAKAAANIVVKNRLEEVQNYVLAMEGVPPDWGEISPNQLSAFPFQEVRAQISIHPPANTQSAIYTMTVVVKSQEQAGVEGRGVVEVELPAVPAPVPVVAGPPDDTKKPASGQANVQRPAPPRVQAASQIELRVEPGLENPPPPPAVQWKLRLKNSGNVLDTFGFSFTGISQNWVSIDPVELQLYPNEEGTAMLVVQPGADIKAGTYPFVLRAFSHVNLNERTEVSLKVEIKASLSFQLDIAPREAEAQGMRDFQVWLSSAANANSDVWLDLIAGDQDDVCEYTFQPREILLPAKQRVMSTLRVSPRSVLGPNERKQVTIKVTAAPRQVAVPAQTVDLRFTQTGAAPVSLSLQPQVQTAEMESDYVVQIANPSGVAVNLSFTATDPEMACDYTFTPDRRYIPANGASSTRLHVKAHAPHRGEGQKQIVFTVKTTRQGELVPISSVQGNLNQVPGKPIAIELIPPQQSSTSLGKYSVRVNNPFNVMIQVWLEARDEEDALEFKLSPQGLRIPPGGNGLVSISVSPKDKLLPTDQRRVHKFVVSALVQGISTPSTVNGIFAQVKGFNWSGPFGKILSFFGAVLKLILKIILWLIPWIIVLIILIFLANLGIAGVYFLVQHDPQLGPIITGLIPVDLIVSLHDSMLFKSIADSIVVAVAKILGVIQTRITPPPPTPTP